MTKEELKEYNRQRWLKLKNDPERYAKHLAKNRTLNQVRYHNKPGLKERILERNKTWRDNNWDKFYAHCKKWREKNPEKVREIARRGQKNRRLRDKTMQQLTMSRMAKRFYSSFYAMKILSTVPRKLPDFCFETKKSYQFDNPRWY